MHRHVESRAVALFQKFRDDW